MSRCAFNVPSIAQGGPMATSVSELTLSDPRLPEIWRRLQGRTRSVSPFLTWTWFRALAAVPEVSADVRVLLAESGGDVLGVLPVERRRSSDGLHVLGPAGGHWLAPDHVDVLAAAEHREQVAAAVTRHLATAAWDLLDFEGLAADGALRAALDGLRRPTFVRLPGQTVLAPYVRLESREPGVLLPSRNLRQQVARGLRACEQTGGGLRMATSPAEVRRLLPVLMQLHNERFGSESQVFASPARRRFHLEAAALLAERGMARVYWLETEGREAALLYAFRSDERLYYYSMGLRPDVGRSPGLTLLGQTLLAAAQEGLREFDLLRGDHAFKLRFASGSRADRRVRLLRATPRSARWALGRLPGRSRHLRAVADVPSRRRASPVSR